MYNMGIISTYWVVNNALTFIITMNEYTKTLIEKVIYFGYMRDKDIKKDIDIYIT
jgi:hypothetical protein